MIHIILDPAEQVRVIETLAGELRFSQGSIQLFLIDCSEDNIALESEG
jgi:hypothetical protein